MNYIYYCYYMNYMYYGYYMNYMYCGYYTNYMYMYYGNCGRNTIKNCFLQNMA